MIQMPLDDILKKIKEETGLSDEELSSKIQQKLDQLSGLISKEGAAHIIANELGIKLFDKVSGRVKIKSVLAGMRSVETVGKIITLFPVREFQRSEGDEVGKVGSFIIGDETGTIRIVAWGEQTDIFDHVKKGDIVKVVDGYVRENNNQKEIHMNQRSRILVNPKGEEVGEVSLNQQDSARKKISELVANESNVELLGTLVQCDSLRYYEIDPQTGKRVREKDGSYALDDGTVVEKPAYAYVCNAILDDGSGNIRVVCFREMAEKLFSLNSTEILSYKDAPETFETVRNKALGTIVKIRGRVTHNSMFDRLEFIAQEVHSNPNPEEESARLDTALEEVQKQEGGYKTDSMS